MVNFVLFFKFDVKFLRLQDRQAASARHTWNKHNSGLVERGRVSVENGVKTVRGARLGKRQPDLVLLVLFWEISSELPIPVTSQASIQTDFTGSKELRRESSSLSEGLVRATHSWGSEGSMATQPH